jgi:uncharacterized protein
MVKLFTDIDLDGLGCGVIAKLAFGDHADVAYCSYRNLNQRVDTFVDQPDHEEVYITDLAVNKEVEQKLAKRFQEGKHVKMIDHHVTASHFNEYEWGIVVPEYDTGKKTCATSLFYEYLLENKLIQENRALEQFIELVRQYDTWEWDENKNFDAKRLNDLFYIMSREVFEEEMLKRFNENPSTFSLNEMENKLLDIEEHKIERYINSKSRQLVQGEIDEYCIGIIHAEQYLSELGNALNKIYPHLDMIALLNMSGKKIGYRTIHDHINVAEYARKYGGGGHPKASGSEMNREAFEKFVVSAFNLPILKPDTERNELNLKGAPYGTSYQNATGEVSYIKPTTGDNFFVVHNGVKQNEVFTTYEEAERHVKRKFISWLRFDHDCIRQYATVEQISIEAVKENYGTIVGRIINKLE